MMKAWVKRRRKRTSQSQDAESETVRASSMFIVTDSLPLATFSSN